METAYERLNHAASSMANIAALYDGFYEYLAKIGTEYAGIIKELLYRDEYKVIDDINILPVIRCFVMEMIQNDPENEKGRIIKLKSKTVSSVYNDTFDKIFDNAILWHYSRSHYLEELNGKAGELLLNIFDGDENEALKYVYGVNKNKKKNSVVDSRFMWQVVPQTALRSQIHLVQEKEDA